MDPIRDRDFRVEMAIDKLRGPGEYITAADAARSLLIEPSMLYRHPLYRKWMEERAQRDRDTLEWLKQTHEWRKAQSRRRKQEEQAAREAWRNSEEANAPLDCKFIPELIADAERYARDWLNKALKAERAGKTEKAARCYAKRQFWLDRIAGWKGQPKLRVIQA